MTPFPNFFPTVGAASTATDLANHLGQIVETDGGLKKYRLVQAAGAISAAAEKILVSAASAGAFTWQANTSTTANDYLAIGVVPTGQKGSTGTTGLVSGDYFLIQIYGPAAVTSAGAIAAGGLVGCSTTAGKADDATVAASVGAIAQALESAAGADESVGIFLFGK
jgi:hypothetical protein